MPQLEIRTADQAESLRRRGTGQPVQVIAVASGKGGVGKTSVSVNLSLGLVQLGRRVMLLDADLGLANVDVLLGLTPRFTLAHVLEGKCGLDDTIIEGPMGLAIVPAASGQRRMAELGPVEHAGLIQAFSELDRDIDSLVVDTAAGIADSVITFAQAAHEVVVVVCNEPASITDAYALIKVLSRERGVTRVQMLANMVRSQAEGRELHEKLTRVTDRFLDVNVDYLGAVPYDDWMRRAIQRQQAVLEAYPNSPSAGAYRGIARRADGWAVPRQPRGNVEFFVERLVSTGVAA